jgi:nifR3 family TIM-barrel protein
MALKIGILAVDPPVVLAPMAGVTNAAFRRLCRRYGAGLYVSEMVSARALVEAGQRTQKMVQFADDETIRSVQLYGVEPRTVAHAVSILVDDVGVHHVDLNFGCPARKVTRRGGGAALPVRRELLRSIVASAVRAAAPVPVTIKMRMGLDQMHLTAIDAGRIAEDEGAAAVALHARTAEQLYSGRADWSAIARLKDAVTSVPVLGNGDIWDAEDAVRMMNETGCDGVVIGRGCLGKPWLFGDLADRFAGRPPRRPPTLGDVVATMRTHLMLLVDHFGEEHAPRDFRKHTGWYMTGFPIGGVRRRALSNIDSIEDFDGLVADFDPCLTLDAAQRRLPRGHTHGPRPVCVPEGWFDDIDDATPPVGADVLVSGG